MKDLPLKYKLAIWSSLVVALALMPVGVVTTMYLYLEQRQALDLRLRQTTQSYLSIFLLDEDDGSILDKHAFMQVFNPSSKPQRFLEITKDDGTILYRTANLEPGDLQDQPLGFSYIQINNLPTRVHVNARNGITVRLAMDMVEIYDATTDLAMGYLIAMPVLLVMVYLGGQFIARKALAPVQRLTDAAERINAQQLDMRLPTPKVHDEIGRLSVVLNGMFDRLDVSFKQATRFSADASHELKTPLAILQVSIEDLLERADLSDDTHNAIAALQEQTQRLTSILENLLLLSRIDAGQVKLDYQQQDITKLVRACIEDAQLLAQVYASEQEEDIDLNVESELPDQLEAQADRGRLTQILLNLLNNAIKYNVPGGNVRVRLTQPKPNSYSISIANTSPALLSLHRERIFQRFFRADQARDKRGHGLGLSLVRDLARAHGGNIVLVRSDGKWTEFALNMPLDPRQNA